MAAKANRHVKPITHGVQLTKYDRGGNNSNKFYAFTDYGDGKDGNTSD